VRRARGRDGWRKLEGWTPWFAWRPVRDRIGNVFWLRKVWRKVLPSGKVVYDADWEI
jgi:hypothetical protein